MSKSLLVLLLMIAGMQSWAQSRAITGSIANSKGDPIPNATVTAKETKQSVRTNVDGQFSLTISAAAKTLVISSVGFATKEVEISAGNNYSITMQESASDLEEVVITAYGATRKKAFTGSAATITSDKFKDLQVTTITGVLQGNASGVLSVTSSGQPGENPVIRIRGIGSFNASSDPLILLDGAPYSGALNTINPADIESITVLKDASATAMYGARGANGILQIVSKSGKGRTKVGFSGISGFSNRAVKEYEKVGMDEYMELSWEALRNDAKANPALLTQFSAANPEEYASKRLIPRTVYNPYNVAQPVGTNGKLDPTAKKLWNDDFMDAVTRTGIRNDVNLSVSGADLANTIKFYMSGGYIHDQGVIIESDYKRYTGRVKVDAAPVKWFRTGFNTSIAYANQNFPYQGNQGGSNVLGFARNISPVYTVYLRDKTNGNLLTDAKGNPVFDYGSNSAVAGVNRPAADFRQYSTGQNPAGTTISNPLTNEYLTGTGVVYAELDLFKGLTFRSQYVLNYNQHDYNQFWNPLVGDGTTFGGLSYRSITLTYAQTFTNTFTYNKTFGDIHQINFLAGVEAVRDKFEFTSAQRTGFTFVTPTQPSYGTVSSAEGTVDKNRMQNYLSRLRYDLMDRYHLSLSLRSDASTKFSDSSRWDAFYSIGTAWNLDKEKFMQNINWLSELKLKASYGTQGNQSLPGSFPYMGTYSAGSNIGSYSGYIINTVGNGNLTWEKQKQLDVGVEFGVFKNRLTGSFVYFNRQSESLLFARPMPGSTGINEISDNTGGVKNSGYEIELNSVNIRNKNFEWRTSFNITKLKNEISEVAPGTTQRKGGSWYDWFIQEYAGVDAADGAPMWYRDDPADATKRITTKNYNQATRYYIGNRLPEFTGGITNNFRYKDFDLTILASFAIGGKMYDGDYAALMGAFTAPALISGSSTDIRGRWQSPENPGDGKTPKLTTIANNASAASSRFLTDITYMRIRNITLGYTLPDRLLKKAFLTNARVFADLQNAFTFFGGNKGTDPEAGLNAQTQFNNTTTNRVFAVGINLGL